MALDLHHVQLQLPQRAQVLGPEPEALLAHPQPALFVPQQFVALAGQLGVQALVLVADPQHTPAGGIEARQVPAIRRLRNLTLLGLGGRGRLRWRWRGAVGLQQHAQYLGHQGLGQGLAAVGIAHHDHRQLLLGQHADPGMKALAETALLPGAHIWPDPFLAAGRQEPAKAYLAVEIQRVAGVLRAHHFVDGCRREQLAVLVPALGEQHAYIAAQVPRAAPQALGGKVADQGIAADTVFIAFCPVRLGAAVPDKARLAHAQWAQQALLQLLFEIHAAAALHRCPEQGITEVGVGGLGSRSVAQPQPAELSRQFVEGVGGACVAQVLAGNAALVAEQAAQSHGPVGGVLVLVEARADVELPEGVLQRRVQLQAPLFHQLHHRRGSQQLRQGTGAKRGVFGHLQAPSLVGEAKAPGPDQLLAVHQGDG